MTFNLDFPFAYGLPTSRALFRARLEDFIVVEDLGFEPGGEGEHIFVKIKKRGENTHYVAEKMAAFLGVKPMDVGVSGLKDRIAETTQWFSIYKPGKEIEVDWPGFVKQSGLNIDILAVSRHHQKLRRGQHRCNWFEITLRDVTHPEEAQARLEKIAARGVPNYFGEQRFGRDGGNLVQAEEWFAGGRPIRNRTKKGLVLSAARAYLFNLVLAERVRQSTWNCTVDGDICLGEFPSGPLWGRGRPAVTSTAGEVELQTLSGFAGWCDRLEHSGLSQERRALVIRPVDLNWSIGESTLKLKFGLPAGEFATSVLREITVLEASPVK